MDLGSTIACYAGKFPKTQFLSAMIGVSFLVIVLFLTALYYTIPAFLWYGPAAAIAWSQYWYIACILIILLGIGYCIYQVHQTIIDITIFDQGLVLRKILKRNIHYRWDEINGIVYHQVGYKSSKPHVKCKTILTFENGTKTILIDQRINNLPEITTRIKAFLYPILLQKYHTQLRSGSQVKFGPIKFDQSILEIKKLSIRDYWQVIKWKQVDRIFVKDGNLIIDNHHKEIRIPITKIPNLDLFLSLITTEIS